MWMMGTAMATAVIDRKGDGARMDRSRPINFWRFSVVFGDLGGKLGDGDSRLQVLVR